MVTTQEQKCPGSMIAHPQRLHLVPSVDFREYEARPTRALPLIRYSKAVFRLHHVGWDWIGGHCFVTQGATSRQDKRWMN
jgi:hypothetical protein